MSSGPWRGGYPREGVSRERTSDDPRRPAALAIAALGISGVEAGAGPDVPAHRHYLVVNGGLVPVGPSLCDGSATQRAFNQLHYGIHAGQPGTDAFIHDHNQVGITARACSFTPCVDLPLLGKNHSL